MKFFNILCILFYVYINFASSQVFDDENKRRFQIKQFPKKVTSGFMQMNYAGKYVKAKNNDYENPFIDSQNAYYEIPRNPKKLGLQQYTTFEQIIPDNPEHNVPESLLFPLNPPGDVRPRIKKVLPDYVWSSLRNKRSADEAKQVEPLKTETNTEKKAAKSVEKKAAKSVEKKAAKNVENKVARQGDKKPPKRAEKKAGPKPQKKLRKGAKHPKVKSKRTSGNNNHTRTKKGRKLRKGRAKGKRQHVKKSASHDGRRLIAARDALIEQYPYVISIQKNNEHWCSGAILNPRLIITTANCMWKSSQISRLKVRVGSRYTNQGGQTFRIQEVMKHPGWKIRKNPDCDVALALLDKRIRFSHTVHSVDLPNMAMMPAFDDAWVTSWGSERSDGIFDTASNSLQVYHVRLMERFKCNNITKRFGVNVTPNFICLTQTGKRAPCTRDTGAPAVSDGVLWGLASWGIRKLCGTERYPAMFSYLASQSNVDFVTNATHQLMSEERFYPYPDKLPRSGSLTSSSTTEKHEGRGADVFIGAL